ncbi:hypothetical protein F5141DRAFT_82594 [Pisolithus sp. B1]|nr:hypothetical protein F5141DRAFT_82594 [Pisolithus sp. B1]
MSNTPAPLHSQKVDPPQDSKFEHTGHDAVPSHCPFDNEELDWTMDGCSSAVSEARKRPMSTCTGKIDDILIRNNHHLLTCTALDDHWIARCHASNHATYPGLPFSPPPVTLSLHHMMGRLLGYSQNDSSVPTFREPPLVPHAAAALQWVWSPGSPIVVTHHSNLMAGQNIMMEPAGTISPFGRRLNGRYRGRHHQTCTLGTPSLILSSENILTSTDLSIYRSFRAVTTINAAILHALHDSAIGMTSGCVGDYGRMDLVSGQDIGSNSSPSSLSDTAPSPREPRTSERSLNTGEGDLATLSGPLAVNYPADDAIVHHDSTMACGWIKPNGKTCDERLDCHCEGHFATAHGIQNMSWDVKVNCRWLKKR